MEKHQYIRFDWAAKYMLRSKADFAIFEGLISVLVGEKVTIVNLLESEANQESASDKFNRVDIKATDSKGEIIIVEIQQTRERDYLQRMLYGVARTVTEHISRGQQYDNIKKVYSINIIYFDLGEGADYLYHGQSKFYGVHTNDQLRLTEHERRDLNMLEPEQVFPEYFIIRVNEFNQLAVTPLEEWLQYLKDEYIKPDTTVPGLKEARERLEYLRMSPEQRRRYDYYIDTLVRDEDVLTTKIMEAEIAARKQGKKEGMIEGKKEGLIEGKKEGLIEGKKEGMKEGLIEGKKEANYEHAQKMKQLGVDAAIIASVTGLTAEEIDKI